MPEAQVEISAFTIFRDTSAKQSEVQHGWTVGGGIEHLVTQNLVLGLEYNYVDLGKAAYRTLDSQGQVFFVDNDVTAHALMGRLSYKFGR